MSTIAPLSSTAASLADPATNATGERAKLSTAAKQFEAIFVRQMLSAARKASFGDELFGSEAVNTFREMQDNQFADIVAEKGSLGLAAQIEAHVARQIASSRGGQG